MPKLPKCTLLFGFRWDCLHTFRKNRSYELVTSLNKYPDICKNDQNVVIETKFSVEKGVKTFFVLLLIWSFWLLKTLVTPNLCYGLVGTDLVPHFRIGCFEKPWLFHRVKLGAMFVFIFLPTVSARGQQQTEVSSFSMSYNKRRLDLKK